MATIVLSGINLFEGGPLSIFYDVLDAIISNGYLENNKIIAFVHNKDDFSKYSDKVEILQLPNSRKNYLYRLYYEYLYFYRYSKKNSIDVWLSLHDITPNVIVKKQFVYCHSPLPFYKADINTIKFAPKIYLLSKIYGIAYKININRNKAVIVQQEWIREEFKKRLGIENILVARPNIEINMNKEAETKRLDKQFIFIYPAFPRIFKNFETVCKACELLNSIENNYRVLFTIDGTENKYSNHIVKKYKHLKNISFIGRQERNAIFNLYSESDCLIFPSKLETWGLPISEYKEFSKPMLVADLPYAHETVGNYDLVKFFNYDNSEELAGLMLKAIRGDKIFTKHHFEDQHNDQVYSNWDSLLQEVFNGI